MLVWSRLVGRSASVTAVAALVAGVVALSPALPAASAPADGGVIPGAYIVSLVDEASPRQVADEHAREHGAQVSHVYEHALRGYAAHMSATAAARTASDSRVRSVVADRKMTAEAQSLPTGIDRIDGELSSAVAGNGSGTVDVDVAVIDTGIDLAHPDLNVVGGQNCSTGRSYKDGNGHGTHVAGTIAAEDNGVGVVGAAPGARLWAVRVLNNAGFGSWSSIICGVDWVTANAATIEVANMSLGGAGGETGCNDGAVHEAICNSVTSGVTYAVAAGNDSDDAANHIPAAYDEVMTVSALADFDGQPNGLGVATCLTDVDDTFADFSNFGADVDLIAPGVCIRSTWKGGGYRTISGTSMAAPHVAGAAGLYIASNPSASPTQVKQALQNAGNLSWSTQTDPDGSPDRLLNVDAL